jgi:hypothetical protein
MMMKYMTIIQAIFLTFFLGCAPSRVEPVIDKDGYYAQVLELLDPDNPNPPASTNDVSERGVKELCGVKADMTMADVVSAWGKPRALGICTADNADLLYGPFSLRFRDDKLKKITPAYRSTWKQQAGARSTNLVERSFALAYREKFNSLFRTNDMAQATRMLKTNSVYSVAKIKAGEISGLRLGMTMSELISIRGKPKYFCRFSTKRATLYGIGLFRGDALWSFSVDVPNTSNGMTFDNGMPLNAPIAEYVKTFGPPLRAYLGMCETEELCYKFGKAYVTFEFSVDSDRPVSDPTKDIAALNGISFHYRGAGDACEEANDRLIGTVVGVTGLDRAKLQSLRWNDDLDEVVKLLEKETRKTLTDTQRKKIVTLLEENKAAIKKAYAEDAE